MSNEWEVARASGRCAITGREFAEGDSYYAVLFEGPEGMDRRDYAVEAWTGPPEGSFCYWRGRVPVREKKPSAITIDAELLTQLFLRLEEDGSEPGQQFRFVLALLLMRKRLLKFEGTVRNEDREYWQLRLMSDSSVHQILNPQLGQQEVDRLSLQLTALLTGEVDAFTLIETGAAPAVEPAVEAQAASPSEATPPDETVSAAEAPPPEDAPSHEDAGGETQPPVSDDAGPSVSDRSE
jgi:hypothetical protein